MPWHHHLLLLLIECNAMEKSQVEAASTNPCIKKLQSKHNALSNNILVDIGSKSQQFIGNMIKGKQ